ncbi:MAG: dihydropyrimidinase [Candidatus Caldarchaeum sp.]|nr:dihydropyrimidinase [Candidatus Caldarchaeum sp.]MDW8435182.1 dihydropyrimidinase [Candidatus Caldarchaeum sp.]
MLSGPLDLVVQNAKIVTSEGVYSAEIGVDEGKIVRIAKSIEDSAERTYDAEGRYVFPGAIDGHVHFKLKYFDDVYTADDFYTGTVAAACGGVTTIIDFVTPESLNYVEDFRRRRAEAEPNVVIDYGLHMSVTNFNEEVVKNLETLFRSEGVASVKIFTAYSKRGLMLDDGKIFKLMQLCKKWNVLVLVHAENEYIINSLVDSFVEEGKTEPIYHSWSRPDFVEAEAIQRVGLLASVTGAEILIVHVSSAAGLEKIVDHRSKGVKIHGETCPHYLIFNEEVYRRPDGAKFIMSPPLKKESDRQALWKGLLDGCFSVVGSDHACFDSVRKLSPKRFTEVPGGVAGTEVIPMILFSEGVLKRGMTFRRFVEVTSLNPARVYGLYPAKGQIAVGSDADFYILDPMRKTRLTKENLHSNIDHSIYEDLEVNCNIVATFSRGELIAEKGVFMGERGRGRYLFRSRGVA